MFALVCSTCASVCIACCAYLRCSRVARVQVFVLLSCYACAKVCFACCVFGVFCKPRDACCVCAVYYMRVARRVSTMYHAVMYVSAARAGSYRTLRSDMCVNTFTRDRTNREAISPWRVMKECEPLRACLIMSVGACFDGVHVYVVECEHYVGA